MYFVGTFIDDAQSTNGTVQSQPASVPMKPMLLRDQV